MHWSMLVSMLLASVIILLPYDFYLSAQRLTFGPPPRNIAEDIDIILFLFSSISCSILVFDSRNQMTRGRLDTLCKTKKLSAHTVLLILYLAISATAISIKGNAIGEGALFVLIIPYAVAPFLMTLLRPRKWNSSFTWPYSLFVLLMLAPLLALVDSRLTNLLTVLLILGLLSFTLCALVYISYRVSILEA